MKIYFKNFDTRFRSSIKFIFTNCLEKYGSSIQSVLFCQLFNFLKTISNTVENSFQLVAYMKITRNYKNVIVVACLIMFIFLHDWGWQQRMFRLMNIGLYYAILVVAFYFPRILGRLERGSFHI